MLKSVNKCLLSSNPLDEKSLSFFIKSWSLNNLRKELALSLVTQDNQWTKLHS